MPFLLFPFRYGSIPAPVVAPPATLPLWGNVTSGAQQNWIERDGPYRVPRLERVFDQVAESDAQLVEYAHRIRSQFAWVIGDHNQIFLRSVITTP